MEINLGNNIKYLREKRNWTTIQLAEFVGAKSDSSITQWENGNSRPRVATLIKLRELFEVDLETLVFGNESEIEDQVGEGRSLSRKESSSSVDDDDKLYNYHELVAKVKELEVKLATLIKANS